jgi:hypothetical protein
MKTKNKIIRAELVSKIGVRVARSGLAVGNERISCG